MKEENSSISSLKEEFAQRIADAEKKVQLACKERDTAKKVMNPDSVLIIFLQFLQWYFATSWADLVSPV